MTKQVEKPRMEEDGLFLDNPKHWEMWEATVYVVKVKTYYKDKEYDTFKAHIHIPLDIVRHLNLEHKQKITVAIKHNEG